MAADTITQSCFLFSIVHCGALLHRLCREHSVNVCAGLGLGCTVVLPCCEYLCDVLPGTWCSLMQVQQQLHAPHSLSQCTLCLHAFDDVMPPWQVVYAWSTVLLGACACPQARCAEAAFCTRLCAAQVSGVMHQHCPCNEGESRLNMPRLLSGVS